MLTEHKWLADHLHDSSLVVIDTRGSIPYAYGHIPNSVPLGIEKVIKIANNGANEVIDAPVAEQLFGSLGVDDNKKVIVYGEMMDPSAARVLWTLLYYGHKDASMLDLGFMAWYRLGLPVTRQPANPTNGKFTALPNPAMRANADFIIQSKEDPNVIILDNRSIQEYMQGKIPKALNFPFTDGMGDKGQTFRSQEELQKLFTGTGITNDKEVVCYCATGGRASHTFLALKLAGFQNVKLYDGSIIDWASRRLPIEH